MSTATLTDTQTLREDFRWFHELALSPERRPISQWVEDEIVLPDGPFKGEPYRHRRHPVSRPWFAAIDAGHWNRFAMTGPTQAGKTLMGYVAPVLWHLFEQQETVIIGLPTMQMGGDKWMKDLLPVIEASRYRDLLPATGEGSRGGMVKTSIYFRNGATLRFMTGGGGDKQRAGFTSRVLAVTETDGMDEPSKTSREADAIEQLEGRTRAFGRLGKRVYLECTASIERGRIWQEIMNGTCSRLVRQCPYCDAWVFPDRPDLTGWQDAGSEAEAADKATWTCPACRHDWTDEDRWTAAASAILCHDGQSVSAGGTLVGESKRTQTLGLRWTAIDNPFSTAADLGAEEWLAARNHDQENSEKKMRQFVWALPYDQPRSESRLSWLGVADCAGAFERRQVAPTTTAIVRGVDVRKTELHDVTLATDAETKYRIADYGVRSHGTSETTVQQAESLILDALRKLRDEWDASPLVDENGTGHDVDLVLIDKGWVGNWTEDGEVKTWASQPVETFCLAAGVDRFLPAKGAPNYSPPAPDRGVIIGDNWHINRGRGKHRICDEVIWNADHWHLLVEELFLLSEGQRDRFELFVPGDGIWTNHKALGQHIEVGARQLREQMSLGVRSRKPRFVRDHWWDALAMGLVGLSILQARTERHAKQKPRRTLAEMAGGK